jgi:hypothetical protein
VTCFQVYAIAYLVIYERLDKSYGDGRNRPKRLHPNGCTLRIAKAIEAVRLAIA